MWLIRWIVLGAIVGLGIDRIANAIPLDSWPTWSVDQPYVSKQIPPGALIMRGTGTDAYYVAEIDPITGAIPISGAGITLGYDENYGTVGATTLRTAAQIGNATGAADFGAGAAGAQTLRVILPTNQSAIPVSESGTWTVQPGNTANTTPWLATISQGGNSATVSAGGALKVDASASTQPISGTVAATQSGTWNITNVSGTVSLPTGAATEASLVKLPVAQGSTTSGQSGPLTQGAVTTVAPSYSTGQTSPLSLTTGGALRVDASSSTQPVSGTVAVSNLPSTVDTNNGLVGASTLRVATGGKAITGTILANNNYASTAVTTSAYVQLIASTGSALNMICASNSSGSIIKVATGAGGAEVDRFYIPAGGSLCYPLNIAASTRVALEALDATASVGYFLFTGLP